jgi:hypothetical protein
VGTGHGSRAGFACSKTGMVGLKPTQGMDGQLCVWVCVPVCVRARAFLCVCVQVEALRRADHPPKESTETLRSSEPKCKGWFHGGRPRMCRAKRKIRGVG